jgi:hypothetical protein
MQGIKKNLLTYGFFVLIAGLGIVYGNQIANNHEFLRVWNLPNLLLLLLAVPFLFLQQKAHLPDFWSPDVSNRSRFLTPMLMGVLFGLLDVLVFKVVLHPEPYEKLPPFLQPFPYSNFLYFSGAVEVEMFYRLIPLTVIMLIGAWYKKGQYLSAFFWTGAVLTALREPIEQLPDGSYTLIAYSFLTGFLMNFLQAIWYRYAGFLASLTIRLGHYLIWHILLGLYVELFELA